MGNWRQIIWRGEKLTDLQGGAAPSVENSLVKVEGKGKNRTALRLWRVAGPSQPEGWAGNVCKHLLHQVNTCSVGLMHADLKLVLVGSEGEITQGLARSCSKQAT